jgi:hypothetical protein
MASEEMQCILQPRITLTQLIRLFTSQSAKKKHSMFLKRVVLVPVTQADASIRNSGVNACAHKTERKKRSELRRTTTRRRRRRVDGRVVSDTTFIPGD